MKRFTPLLLAALLAAALLLFVRGVSPAAALSLPPAVDANLSGIVTRADTFAPLAGIVVETCVHDSPVLNCGAPAAATTTQVNGAWALRGLKPDAYYLRLRDPAGYWATTYWPRGSAIWEGAMIDLNGGGDAVGLDAALPPGATVRGVVTADDGQPLDEVTVYLWLPSNITPWAAAGERVLRGDGAYAFTGLGPGDYRLQYYTHDSRLFGEWWNNSPDNYGAAPLDLSPGLTLTADVVLRAGALLTGSVRGAGEMPLAGITLQAWQIEDGRPEETRVWHTSDAFGAWRLGPLEDGAYILRAYDPNEFYQTAFYPDVVWWGDALSVTVSAGLVQGGLNLRLRPVGGLGETTVFLPRADR